MRFGLELTIRKGNRMSSYEEGYNCGKYNSKIVATMQQCNIEKLDGEIRESKDDSKRCQ